MNSTRLNVNCRISPIHFKYLFLIQRRSCSFLGSSTTPISLPVIDKVSSQSLPRREENGLPKILELVLYFQRIKYIPRYLKNIRDKKKSHKYTGLTYGFVTGVCSDSNYIIVWTQDLFPPTSSLKRTFLTRCRSDNSKGTL